MPNLLKSIPSLGIIILILGTFVYQYVLDVPKLGAEFTDYMMAKITHMP